MTRRNWKRLQPSSLRQALEWCKDYARERHNLSVERIAQRLGLADHFALYKWINTGRMPAVMIPAYESVCGINFVSRWLAAGSGHVLIEIPTGRHSGTEDMQALQEALHRDVGELMKFYNGKAEAADALAAVLAGIESLAWHRGNIQQHEQPQLLLGDFDE